MADDQFTNYMQTYHKGRAIHENVHSDQADLALGNGLGSNTFNIYFVLGVTDPGRPLPIHAANTVDLIAMVGANLLLFATIIFGRRLVLARWEGSVLVASYLAYLVAVIARIQ